MKSLPAVVAVLLLLGACRRESVESSSSPSPTTTPPGAPAAEPPRGGYGPGGTVGRRLEGYPRREDACTRDADCGLVSVLRTDPGLTGCCTRCNEHEAGTRAWVEAAVAACMASGPCSDDGTPCPATTVNPFLAVCEDGRCVVRRNPAVWGDQP